MRWRILGGRPASGRSFVVVIVVASLAALAVMVWTFRSMSEAQRARGVPAGFQI